MISYVYCARWDEVYCARCGEPVAVVNWLWLDLCRECCALQREPCPVCHPEEATSRHSAA
jgi:hypothetical protein